MVMHWRDTALALAGVIGGGTAIVHGVLVQRLMVGPIDAAFRDDRRMGAAARRLVPALLHVSTAGWFVAGLALVAAAYWLDASARLATALFAGSLYLYAAIGNFWGTRGRHPGWVLMAVSLVLIGFGAIPFGD
jgi:hypothetical protein